MNRTRLRVWRDDAESLPPVRLKERKAHAETTEGQKSTAPPKALLSKDQEAEAVARERGTPPFRVRGGQFRLQLLWFGSARSRGVPLCVRLASGYFLEGVPHRFERYTLVIQEEGKAEASVLPKIECLYVCRQDLLQTIARKAGFDFAVWEQRSRPARSLKERLPVPKQSLRAAQENSWPIELTLHDGTVFRGKIVDSDRFHVVLALARKKTLLLYKHAILRAEVFKPSEDSIRLSKTADLDLPAPMEIPLCSEGPRRVVDGLEIIDPIQELDLDRMLSEDVLTPRWHDIVKPRHRKVMPS